MKLFYWVREFSESSEFPEVHIYRTEHEARASMVAEAIEAQENNPDAWLTQDMDGPAVTMVLRMGGHIAHSIDAINLQWEGGAVDCFRLMSQDVTP